MATVFAAVAAFVGTLLMEQPIVRPHGSTTACDVFDIHDHSQNRINIGKKEKGRYKCTQSKPMSFCYGARNNERFSTIHEAVNIMIPVCVH